MRRIIISALMLITGVGISSGQQTTAFVDPFIGTDGHGHTFPGATTPFGMVQLSPDNPVSGWDWSSGYHWTSGTIAGFSHTHLSGTGVGDLLDVSVLPIQGFEKNKPFAPNAFYAKFSHNNEQASPGYYAVEFNNGIKTELTATPRCGFHKYTFTENLKAQVMIDLGFNRNTDIPYETVIEKISNTEIQGYRFSGGWADKQKLYFYAKFSQPIISAILFDENNKLVEGNKVLSKDAIKKGVKAVFEFEQGQSSLFLKVAISSASIEGAKRNFKAEIANLSFDQAKEQAQDQWEAVLSKVEVKSDDTEKKTVFYTAMYHASIAPNLYSDVDGSYTGVDGELHQNKKSNNYFTFSLWDTYRASHPLFTILQPKMVNNFLEAFLMQYNESGLLPVWSLWGNETNCMIGYHSIPVIVDAYFKGLISKKKVLPLYDAMKTSANQNIRSTPIYKTYGYIPSDLSKNSVSITLEYAYDDWCIAQMARALEKSEDYEIYAKRALSYRNLFNSESNLMQPKLKNGEWKEFNPFDTGYKNDYTEANAFQYTWYVPHNIEDLIDLMGGKNEFVSMLDSIFEMPVELGEKAAKDVSGFIGQYIHGNEPSHHIAYLYNYVGQPYKAHERINQIMKEMYNTKPDGLCGNEDCGQMSAWYIFSAMGMYPVNPAVGKYDLGTPAFPYMKLKVGKKEFEIEAHNFSEQNIYVQKVLLNGTEITSGFVSHSEIVKGGKLEFFMGDKPNFELNYSN